MLDHQEKEFKAFETFEKKAESADETKIISDQIEKFKVEQAQI